MINVLNMVTDEAIKEEYSKFKLPSDIMNDLAKFLAAWQEYISNPDIDNRIVMKQTFDTIYHNTKYAFHVKLMTEQDFFRLTDMLRKGV